MSTETAHILPNVILRIATPTDGPALRRLAALDSDVVPELPILLAEVEGEPAAAWSMSEQRAIADPFSPTAHLVGLLREHAGGEAAPPLRGAVARPLRELGHAGPRAA